MTRNRLIEAIIVISLITAGTVILIYQFHFNRKFLYEQCDVLFSGGRYREAIQRYEKFLKRYPEGEYVEQALEELEICRIAVQRDPSIVKKLRVQAGTDFLRWARGDIKTLHDAVELLAPVAEVSIFIHPDATSSTGTPAEDCEISLVPKAGMTFEDHLNKLTRPHKLLWTARNQAVIIADAKTMPAILKKRDRRGLSVEKADKIVWERLEREGNITFPGGETTLEDIRSLIAPLAMVNMFIHPFSQSPSGRPLADTPFTFRTVTGDMTFENMLDNLAMLLLADWTVRNQAVMIATPDRISSIEKRPTHKEQPKDEAEIKTWEKLQKESRMIFPGGENTLKDITQLLSQVHEIEIEIDPDAKRIGLPLADVPFTFNNITQDITVENMLDISTILVDADWTIRDGKVFISTPERLGFRE